MKVYVVTQGIYSDYHIITATTDKELAKQIAKKYSANILDEDDRAQVEVFEDAEERLLPFWDIAFYENGEVKKIKNVTPHGYDRANVYIRKDKTACAQVYADSAEAAIKIATEARAQALAQEGWL